MKKQVIQSKRTPITIFFFLSNFLGVNYEIYEYIDYFN